jgi:hypothetical protein
MASPTDDPYDLDRLLEDAYLVRVLLETMLDTVGDVDFGGRDQRDPALDRLAALIRIAAANAAAMHRNVEENYTALLEGRSASTEVGNLESDRPVGD